MEIQEIRERINNGSFYDWTEWRKLRPKVIERDNNECQVCGIPKQRARLYVHHKKELKDFPHLALDINNLQTLCGVCHNNIHEKQEQMTKDNKKKKFINEERW